MFTTACDGCFLGTADLFFPSVIVWARLFATCELLLLLTAVLIGIVTELCISVLEVVFAVVVSLTTADPNWPSSFVITDPFKSLTLLPVNEIFVAICCCAWPSAATGVPRSSGTLDFFFDTVESFDTLPAALAFSLPVPFSERTTGERLGSVPFRTAFAVLLVPLTNCASFATCLLFGSFFGRRNCRNVALPPALPLLHPTFNDPDSDLASALI